MKYHKDSDMKLLPCSINRLRIHLSTQNFNLVVITTLFLALSNLILVMFKGHDSMDGSNGHFILADLRKRIDVLLLN